MVELFRARESALADEIEAELKAMCAAHTVTVVERPLSFAPELPAVRHGEQIVAGEKNLRAYLLELDREIYDFSRRFTGDYCYLGDDGEVC